MKSHPHTIFPVNINYKGSKITTKVLKYVYTNRQVLYKIALPSAISPVQQCWIAKSHAQWKQIMGPETNGLLPEIISAIQKHEHIPMIQAKAGLEINLKSA